MATGLQNIIDNADSMVINRRKVAAIQYSRNEIARVSVLPTKQPWKFALTMPNKYRYNDARALMEALDLLDVTTPETVSFSNNAGMSWIFCYQGALTAAQISAMTVTSFVGNTLILGGLPTLSSSTIMFKPNDLIQIAGYTYPFTVTNSAGVLRGSGTTISITTHRPNIITNSVVGLGIIVGNDCSFKLFCPNMPTYKLIPGSPLWDTNGVKISGATLEWNDSFQLIEWVGTA